MLDPAKAVLRCDRCGAVAHHDDMAVDEEREQIICPECQHPTEKEVGYLECKQCGRVVVALVRLPWEEEYTCSYCRNTELLVYIRQAKRIERASIDLVKARIARAAYGIPGKPLVRYGKRYRDAVAHEQGCFLALAQALGEVE